LALLPAAAFAQEHQHDAPPVQPVEDAVSGHDMKGMDMSGDAMAAAGEGSGTSRLPPNETMNHGAMVGLGGDAMLMFHGFVSLTENLFMIGMALWMLFQ
jgi:hypothetical protein